MLPPKFVGRYFSSLLCARSGGETLLRRWTNHEYRVVAGNVPKPPWAGQTNAAAVPPSDRAESAVAGHDAGYESGAWVVITSGSYPRIGIGLIAMICRTSRCLLPAVGPSKRGTVALGRIRKWSKSDSCRSAKLSVVRQMSAPLPTESTLGTTVRSGRQLALRPMTLVVLLW